MSFAVDVELLDACTASSLLVNRTKDTCAL